MSKSRFPVWVPKLSLGTSDSEESRSFMQGNLFRERRTPVRQFGRTGVRRSREVILLVIGHMSKMFYAQKPDYDYAHEKSGPSKKLPRPDARTV